MPPPNLSPPHEYRNLSLEEWVIRADDFPPGHQRTHFLVTGRESDEPGEVVYDADPLQNCIQDEQLPNLLYTRDYDSMFIIFHKRLHFRSSIQVFVIPRPGDVLRINTCISAAYEDDIHGRNLHRIPNIGFGTVDAVLLARLFFPNVTGGNFDDFQVKLELTHIQSFYDLAIRPAVMQTLPETQNHWPASIEAEYERARRTNGVLTHGTHDLPAHRLNDFWDSLHNKVEEEPRLAWAQGFFLLVEAKGTKEKTRHHPQWHHDDDDKHVTLALNPILKSLDLEDQYTADGQRHSFPLDKLWIDVATEVELPGYTLHWRSDSHWRIASYLLGVDERRALQLSRLKSFKTDVTCLNYAIGGFRFESSHLTGVGRNQETGDNPFEMAKIMAYTTDKSGTYLKDKNKFAKFLDPTKVLQRLPAPSQGLHPLLKYVESMDKVYSAESQSGKDGRARLEVRVPSRHMLDVLRELPEDLLRSCLVAIPTGLFWLYKELRLEGFSSVIHQQILSHPPRLRGTKNALTLCGSMVWAINGLNNRPDDTRAGKALRDSCLAWAEEVPDPQAGLFDFGEDELAYVAIQPRNSWFVHKLEGGGETPDTMYHLRSERAVELGKLKEFFKVEDFKSLYPKHRSSLGSPTNRRKEVSNRTRQVHVDVPPSTTNVFNFSGFENIIGAPIDTSEMETEVQEIWDLWVTEAFAKSPSKGGKEKWFKDDRTTVHRSILSTPIDELGSLWNGYQLRKKRDQQMWDDIFNHLFRASDADIPDTNRLQNYSQCSYWARWMDIRKKNAPQVVELIRKKMRVEFNKFVWAPYASNLKIWDTTQWRLANERVYGTPKGPRLFANPNPLM